MESLEGFRKKKNDAKKGLIPENIFDETKHTKERLFERRLCTFALINSRHAKTLRSAEFHALSNFQCPDKQ